jgi:hypothetical protein
MATKTPAHPKTPKAQAGPPNPRLPDSRAQEFAIHQAQDAARGKPPKPATVAGIANSATRGAVTGALGGLPRLKPPPKLPKVKLPQPPKARKGTSR